VVSADVGIRVDDAGLVTKDEVTGWSATDDRPSERKPC
jgi:hypothetical protein